MFISVFSSGTTKFKKNSRYLFIKIIVLWASKISGNYSVKLACFVEGICSFIFTFVFTLRSFFLPTVQSASQLWSAFHRGNRILRCPHQLLPLILSQLLDHSRRKKGDFDLQATGKVSLDGNHPHGSPEQPSLCSVFFFGKQVPIEGPEKSQW